MSISLNTKQVFDKQRMRHYLNGELSVLHCHHYSTLFTQLADDADWLNGPQLLAESAEESIYPVLSKYFNDENVSSMEDRIAIAEQYYAHVGLGQVTILASGQEWNAEMPHAHVDEGWIKKWDTRNKAVNFIGQGFLAAAVAAINNEQPGSYRVAEIQSIVKGAETSKFTITKK